jgi:pyridinium-3,5-biscarboxylic acid mononucleotide synthase
MAEFTFDFGRRERIGLAEAVLCQGKTTSQISNALALARAQDVPLLLTRLAAEAFEALEPTERIEIDYDPLSRTGLFGRIDDPLTKGTIAVVTGGTSDLAVAREAVRTLAFYGVGAHEITDVGVAGLWRILQHEAELKAYPIVIVAAGMEGALFSVIGGLVGGLVIAVPTSNGYGVARGGETALSAALTSCAPGLVAVNIDNGYGAACAALRVIHRIR